MSFLAACFLTKQKQRVSKNGSALFHAAERASLGNQTL
jgi:hypothetical protein